MKLQWLVIAGVAVARLGVIAADPALARLKHKAAPPLRRPAGRALALRIFLQSGAAAERLRAAGLSPTATMSARIPIPISASNSARSGDRLYLRIR